MAYCAAAQRECKYLDGVELLKEETLLRRAAGEGVDADVASSVERGLDKVTSGSLETCEADYCGLIGLAVNRIIIMQADEAGKQ